MPTLGTLSVRFSANLSVFNKQIRRFTTKINALGKVVDATNTKLMRQTVKTGDVLATNVSKSFSSMGPAFRKATQGVQKEAQGLGNFFKDFSQKVQHYLTFTIGVQLVMGSVRALQNLISNIEEFERAATNATVVSGHLGASFDEVRNHIEDVAVALGKKTVFTATEVSNAYYQLASAGYDVSKIGQRELLPFLNYAAATQSDLTESTYSLVASLKQFHMNISDATKVADVFTAAISSTFATAERLKEAFKYTGTIAGTLGQSLEGTTAAVAHFMNVGMEGGQAGQRLNMIFTKLLKPTDKGEKAFKGLGLTLADVNPKAKSLTSILWTLRSAGFGASDAAEIFRARTAAAAISLVDNAESVQTLEQNLRLAGGTASNIATKQLDTLYGALTKLKSALEAAGLSARKFLIPVITTIADAIRENITPTLEGFGSVLGSVASSLGFLAGPVKFLSSILFILLGNFLLLGGSLKVLGALAPGVQQGFFMMAYGATSLNTVLKGILKSSLIMATSMMIINNVFKNTSGVVKTLATAFSILLPLLITTKLYFGKLLVSSIATSVAMKKQAVATYAVVTGDYALLGAHNSLLTTYYLLQARALKRLVVSKLEWIWSKKKTIMLGLETAGLILYNLALAISTRRKYADVAANTALTASTNLQTAAQWALNAATYAFPLFMIIGAAVAIGLIAASILKFMDASKKEEVVTKQLSDDLDVYIAKSQQSIDIHEDLAKAEENVATKEEKLNQLHLEGKDNTEEYAKAVKDLQDAYKNLNELIQEAAKIDESMLEAGSKALNTLRGLDEELAKAIDNEVEITKKQNTHKNLEEDLIKAQSDRQKALDEYSNTVATYGANSDEVAEALNRLEEADKNYWDTLQDVNDAHQEVLNLEAENVSVLKKLNSVNRDRFSIAQSIISLQNLEITLQQRRDKLLAEENVLLRVLANREKLYAEQGKKAREEIEKLYEAEDKLYKLRKETPSLIEDIFNSLASYGLLTEDLIQMYKDFEEAQAELTKTRMDYFKIMSGLSEGEQKQVNSVIKRYLELREQGVDANTAWMQAQDELGVHLSDFLNSLDESAVRDYADAQYDFSDATNALSDAFSTLYDTMGSLDFGDLPYEIEQLLEQLASIPSETDEATSGVQDAIDDLSKQYEGFVDTTVKVWRGLQDTDDESVTLLDTWNELVGTSDALTRAAAGVYDKNNDLAASLQLLQSLFPDRDLNSLTEAELVAAASAVEWANQLNLPIDSLTTMPDLLAEIQDALDLPTATPFSDIVSDADTILGIISSMKDVTSELNDTMLKLNSTVLSLKTAMQMAMYDSADEWKKTWGVTVDSLWSEWKEATGGGEKDIDNFIAYLYNTFPTDMATQFALDFGNAHQDISGIWTDLDTLGTWMNEHQMTVQIQSLVSSTEFKNRWINDLNGLSEYLNTNRFPADVLLTLDGQDWVELTGIITQKHDEIQGAIIDNGPLDAAIKTMYEETQIKKTEDDIQSIINQWGLTAEVEIKAKSPPKTPTAGPDVLGILGDFIASTAVPFMGPFNLLKRIGVLQKGGLIKGPQFSIIGENGPEAVIPLAGANKKYGINILKTIIPRYFPMLGLQAGGYTGGGGSDWDALVKLWQRAFSADALERNANAIESLTQSLSGLGGQDLSKLIPVAAEKFAAEIQAGGEGLKYAMDWIIQNEQKYDLDKIQTEKIASAEFSQMLRDASLGFYNMVDDSSYQLSLASTYFYDSIANDAVPVWNDAISNSAFNWNDYILNTTATGWNDYLLTTTAPEFSQQIIKSGAMLRAILLPLIVASMNAAAMINVAAAHIAATHVTVTHEHIYKYYHFYFGWAKGGIAGLQKGDIVRGRQLIEVGEKGPEAVIPLVGANKKFGRRLLDYIIPKYYPEMMKQGGGIFNDMGGGITINTTGAGETYTINGPIYIQGVSNINAFMQELKKKARASAARR